MHRGLVTGVLLAACAPSKPATHPDRDAVKSAQKGWCAMLAGLDDETLSSWPYRTECLEAYPAGSAAFVERLTGCYEQTVTDRGEDAPDSATIIDSCTAEVMATADPGDVRDTELFRARCERQERCQSVGYDACVRAWERVPGPSRAMLTAMYNLRAQTEIAGCLRDTDCTDDEQAAEDACYQPAKDRLVWLPLSTGSDPAVTPDID